MPKLPSRHLPVQSQQQKNLEKDKKCKANNKDTRTTSMTLTSTSVLTLNIFHTFFGIVFSALVSQSRILGFKTTEWLQDGFSFSSF